VVKWQRIEAYKQIANFPPYSSNNFNRQVKNVLSKGYMAFITISNIKGKVYIPETKPQALKKQNCHDCFSCQHCSESRCQACMSEEPCKNKKPSESDMSPEI